MKTKTQVIKDNSEYKRLINAVISNVGIDNIENINNHGIDGGYSGFIYYSETHQFAMKYRKDIVMMLENTADELGEEISDMVMNFRCITMSDKENRMDLYKYIGGGKLEQCQITNAMAWFAAEEVCRMFED
jgi:hypothetical protein